MNKFDVDWRPTLHLGHDKTDVNALEAAQERAIRTAARRKKIDEAIQSEINTVRIYSIEWYYSSIYYDIIQVFIEWLNL